jgi:hypothetical protein
MDQREKNEKPGAEKEGGQNPERLKTSLLHQGDNGGQRPEGIDK